MFKHFHHVVQLHFGYLLAFSCFDIRQAASRIKLSPDLKPLYSNRERI